MTKYILSRYISFLRQIHILLLLLQYVIFINVRPLFKQNSIKFLLLNFLSYLSLPTCVGDFLTISKIV